MHTVGAGGGSIAHVPELTKALRVGPQSAGAEPGPAAYGKGGDRADRDRRERRPRPPAAAPARRRDGARRRGGARPPCRRSPTRWASTPSSRRRRGSSRSSTRTWPARCGSSPSSAATTRATSRSSPTAAPGPLHANALAKLMGSFPVIVPPAPGLLCAIGDLVADFRDEFAQTYIRLVSAREPATRSRTSSTASASRRRRGSTARGSPQDAQRIAYTADMRYHRQGYEIPVALDPGEVRGNGARRPRGALQRAARAALRLPHAGHRLGDRQPARGRLRRRAEARAAGRRRSARRTRRAPSSTSTRSSSTASASRRRSTTARSCSRAPLLDGPAIVTEFDSTTVVLPGYRAEVDANFNILITPND